jgi:hypothetical protein
MNADDTQDCYIYWCPTSEEYECATYGHSGFDTCCDHTDCPWNNPSIPKIRVLVGAPVTAHDIAIAKWLQQGAQGSTPR